MASNSGAVSFSSSSGKNIIRRTLSNSLPFDPHDYQIDGVCKALDGQDILVNIATGSGKSGYFYMYMLVALALAKDDSLASQFTRRFPRNPAGVIVFPTNGLEEEMAVKFTQFGLACTAINSNTLEEARNQDKDLWHEARTSASLILLSPEQLVSKNFEVLLNCKEFDRRSCFLGVDEVHLLNSWGGGFRKAFQQIGYICARMHSTTTIIAATATLLSGQRYKNVCNILGLVEGHFYYLHRSNLRPEVATIFRRLHGGLGGWTFPDLDWVLDSGRKAVIHCRAIALGFCVALYLWSRAPRSPQREIRIRLYNALNSAAYNTETRRLFREDSRTQVIIATTSFMIGMDFAQIQDIILMGYAPTLDEHLQWEGRPGRDYRVVQDARCITYFQPGTGKIAHDLVDGKIKVMKKPTGGTGGSEMDIAMAQYFLAECKTVAHNEQYENPPDETPCACEMCTRKSKVSILRCRCSGPGCAPEPLLPTVKLPSAFAMNNIKKADRLTRVQRKEAIERFDKLRLDIYKSMDSKAGGFFPPDVFLPDHLVKNIVDNFYLLQTFPDLEERLVGQTFVRPYAIKLWSTIHELRLGFADARKQKSEASAGRRRGRQMDAYEGGEPDDGNDSDGKGAVVRILPEMLYTFNVHTLQPVSPNKHRARPRTFSDDETPGSPSKRARVQAQDKENNVD